MKNTALSAGREKIQFKNESHHKFYEVWIPKCRYQDVYHKALVYCLGLDEDTRNHVSEIYDFEKGYVKVSCFQSGWMTSGSARVVRMAFNLYCNGVPSLELYEDQEEHSEIFSNKGTNKYYRRYVEIQKMEDVEDN